MLKIKLLLLLSVLCNVMYAQTGNAENIQKSVLKDYTYQELEKKFYETKPEDVKSKRDIAKYYLQKAKEEKDEVQIAEAYVMLHVDESLPNALKYLDSLQSVTKKSKEIYYPARTYLLRGNLYFKSDNLQAALNNYVLGLKYAKEKGYKRQIAMAEISIAYLKNYIGKHAETAKTLRYYLYNADYMNESEHTILRLNLADAYIEINKMDSAYMLIQDGLLAAKKSKNVYAYHQNLGLLGYYNLKLKKYNVAIENLLKCKNFFFTASYPSKRNQNYTLLNLGKAYAGLQESNKAIENFAKIDSMVLKTNYVFPELREVYTYLIDHYKEKKDKEKQLYYVERFLDVDKVLDTRFRYISRELPRRYDTPNLLQEKESIIKELKQRKIFLYIVLGILVIVLLLFVNFYFKYKNAEKKYRKIAQDLIQSVNENKKEPEAEIQKEEVVPDIVLPQNIENTENVENTEDKTTKTISEDITQSILKELDIFEKKEQFLNRGITLGTLAKKIKTNSKYLSEVINTHKGKNFAAYLNDLRIDYAISRLARDRRFRSYKIPFIAEELGYNNEQAFTLAFKKRTGTPLSIYLKEIEKTVNETKDNPDVV
ncbi:helix-turn-helix domain-containing protein [Chryseobacterium sp. WG14]|uniref:helix-turn-helix domain-containing protein n=1 Tax=Chryseobacterium sp. WG14 TaxID=2926909 RepID=UPI00211ECDBD|nr:helix-turn-helix domain-containing protein [Chryseobacterium sp. WG14]MCQ9639774.1 helix-turn-helix domain-containing protein [Chryseobacterium sp. WG14]